MAASTVAPQSISTLGDFDPRVVQYRDPVTKLVTKHNPYKLIVADGVRYFEHPKGSGNLWYENREHAGRLEKGVIMKDVTHKVYIAPVTEDQKLASQVSTTRQENERLLRELAEIKRELAAKAKPAPAVEAKSV